MEHCWTGNNTRTSPGQVPPSHHAEHTSFGERILQGTRRLPRTAIIVHILPTASGGVPPRNAISIASSVSRTVACTPWHCGVSVVKYTSTASPLGVRLQVWKVTGWLSTIRGRPRNLTTKNRVALPSRRYWKCRQRLVVYRCHACRPRQRTWHKEVPPQAHEVPPQAHAYPTVGA